MELKFSNAGKETFQRWKTSFPPLEILFSKAGKFLENCREGQLRRFSGIKGLTNRVRSMAQTHRPLFEGEIYLTGREVCERLFLSPRTLQDYRDKNIIPYTQIAGKILYRLSDINRILSENYVNRNLHR